MRLGPIEPSLGLTLAAAALGVLLVVVDVVRQRCRRRSSRPGGR